MSLKELYYYYYNNNAFYIREKELIKIYINYQIIINITYF
jgi:hypothetical protein